MRGKINGLFGAEKSGKSRLLCWVLAGLLVGRDPRLALPVHPLEKRWLYLAGEEMIADVIGRLRAYQTELGGDGNAVLPIDFIEATGMRLELERERLALEQTLAAGDYGGLIIEPLRRVHGGEESSNDEMARLNNDLRRWSNHYGLTILLVHHTGKLNEFADTNRIATWSRGCSDLAAILDTAAFLEQVERTSVSRKLKVLRAGRYPPVDPMMLVDMKDPDAGGRGFVRVRK